MLDQGRYTWRHNSILNLIHLELKHNMSLPSKFKVIADLPGSMSGISTIPTDILITSQRPDLVVIDQALKKILILELTVPYDINVDSAHDRKIKRYENLVRDLNTVGYETIYLAIEIGARGFISKDNQSRIVELLDFTGISISKNIQRTLKDLNASHSLGTFFVVRHTCCENFDVFLSSIRGDVDRH